MSVLVKMEKRFPDRFSLVHQRVVQWVKLAGVLARRVWCCSHPNGSKQCSCACVYVPKGVPCGVCGIMAVVCAVCCCGCESMVLCVVF